MLSLPGLQSDIRDILESGPASAAQAAQRFAQAYNSYASAAVAGVVPPVIPSYAPLQGPLAIAFAASPGAPPTAAAAFGAGVSAYWLTAVFAGMVAPPVPIGAPALVPALTGIFSVALPTDTHAAKAAQIAAALDAFTRTVTVTILIGIVPTPFTLL